MPDYKNTLRWVEPFGGWEADTEDTGLCNRIFHWEVAYEINKNKKESQKKKEPKVFEQIPQEKNEEIEHEIFDDNEENEKEKIPKKKFNKQNKKDTIKAAKKEEEKVIIPQVSLESIKDHLYTFNLKTELFTILYSTLIFKWIQTDRVNF